MVGFSALGGHEQIQSGAPNFYKPLDIPGNTVPTAGLQYLGEKIFNWKSSDGRNQVTQYASAYYNSTYNCIFYLVDTYMNAWNGANLESGGAAGDKSTVYNIMDGEGYSSTYWIHTPWGNFPITTFSNYGYLQDPSRPGYITQSQTGSVSYTSSFQATVGGTGGSVGGQVGVTTTYDIFAGYFDVTHVTQNFFGSYYQSNTGGQTFGQFQSVIETLYNPGHPQFITLNSGGNVTFNAKLSGDWVVGVSYRRGLRN